MGDTPRLGIRLHGGLAPQRCVELAVAAEAQGFASAWFAENPLERGALPALAACAAATRRIELGIGVWNPFLRHCARPAGRRERHLQGPSLRRRGREALLQAEPARSADPFSGARAQGAGARRRGRRRPDGLQHVPSWFRDLGGLDRAAGAARPIRAVPRRRRPPDGDGGDQAGAGRPAEDVLDARAKSPGGEGEPGRPQRHPRSRLRRRHRLSGDGARRAFRRGFRRRRHARRLPRTDRGVRRGGGHRPGADFREPRSRARHGALFALNGGMRALKFLVVAIAALVASTIQAPAQEWPGKPIHFIVPFAAGGSTDVLTLELRTPCVVENKGGAGGNMGGAAVATSPADGYTFLVSAPGVLAYNKILYREMAFDPDKDLDPICLYAFQPNVLVVHPSLPPKSVAELIAYAKAHPHQLNYASGGVGSTSHVAGELFKTMAGLEWQHVPYRGTGPSLVDLLAGP